MNLLKPSPSSLDLGSDDVDDWLATAPPRNVVSPDRPYAFLVEPEDVRRRPSGGRGHGVPDEPRVSLPLPDV